MRDNALNENGGGWSALRSSTEVDTRRKKITARATRRKTEGEQEGNKEMSAKATSSLNSNSFHISKSQKEVFPNKRPLRAVKPMA